MAKPNNPNVARVTMQYHRGTRVVENTFHLYRPDGWTADTLLSSLEATWTWFNTYIKPSLTSALALYNIHGVVYDPLGSPWVADRPVSPEVPGLTTGPFVPGSNTVTLSERANLAGRAYRGRIYWPGLATAQVNGDDTVSSGLISAFATIALQWLAAFAVNGPNGTLVIFHRNDNLFSTVRSVVLENILDSQRRRLPGRGI